MKLKKAVLLLLIMSLVLSFVGCTKTTIEPGEIALTVDNVGVDAGVFAYYLDQQIKTNDKNTDKAVAIKSAEELCINYIAINTEFNKRDLLLSTSEKSSLASSVDEIWYLYGGYYEKVGVTKETITKIETNEAYKDKLISSIFGPGGDKEISDDAMEDYFIENYVSFKYINDTLSGDEEKDKVITTKFKDIDAKIGAEDPDTEEAMSFGDAIKKYCEETEEPVISIESGTTNLGDDSFPEQLFNDVSAMELDDHKVLTYDDNIFVIQRIDGVDNFPDYKSEILDFLTNSDYEKLMSTYGNLETVGDSAVESSCYDLIKNAKTISE